MISLPGLLRLGAAADLKAGCSYRWVCAAVSANYAVCSSNSGPAAAEARKVRTCNVSANTETVLENYWIKHYKMEAAALLFQQDDYIELGFYR